MNRLWIYLSLAFTAVIILAFVGIGVTVRISSEIGSDTNNVPPPEVTEYLQESRRQQFAPDVTLVAITIGVIAIGAGVWISHRLTKPLLELEGAAIAIGQQDLSRRVPVKGSQEFLAVATAFNDMASLLAQEETLRRNLLADVAHELRHPIHILQGNLQAILDDVYPMTKNEIGKLLDQTQHLSILVNDLHVLAQAEAQRLPLFKQDTDIASLVKDSAASYSSLAAERKIALRVELLGTIPESIYVDAARIRQALLNLLDNSLRHTPDNGTVTVSVEQTEFDLQIRVSDTGEGISEDLLPYLFERFYRSDKARQRSANSTGLGLAIVKAIVEAHGGNIVAESPGIGQGSSFVMSLNCGP